jgi:hypothetical protein
MKRGMGESFVEDVASQGGSVDALALRGGAAKCWVWGARRPEVQPRNGHYRGAEVLWMSGRQYRWRRFRELSVGPAGSKSPSMCVISSC